MTFRGIRSAVLPCLAVALFICTPTVKAESRADELRAALDQLDQWLTASPHGVGWREYLQTDRLRAELAKENQADPRVVWELLGRHASGLPGLEVSEFYRPRRALENWLAELPPPSIDQLPGELRLARNVFIPRSSHDVAEAKANLLVAAQGLDARLTSDGPNGAAWRKFLRWDTLQKELAKDAPDLRVLDGVYAQYDSGREGLELVWFADVRQALHYYLATARIVNDVKVKVQYQTILDALVGLLEKYRAAPSAEQAMEINKRMLWLRNAGQSQRLIRAIQSNYTQPNLFAHVSAGLVGAGIAGPVNDTGPVTDVILGTSIQGTAVTKGTMSTELAPSTQYAAIDAIFQGEIASDTTGYNGPVQVFSKSLTQAAGRKRLLMDTVHAWTLPAASNAVTSSNINSIAARSSRVERVAWSRAGEQKGEAEQIAARHAEERLNQRLDKQADEAIARLNARYAERLRDPLLQRGLFPRMASVSSTPDALHVTAVEGRLTALGSPSAPPAPQEKADLVLQLHESMVNNSASDAFSGMIVEEERFLATLKYLLGEVPERLRREDKADPWAITFAADQPISAIFNDGVITIAFRGRQYAKADGQYPGMNVKAVYKVQKTADKIKLVRQGNLEIVPPGFVPGSGDSLSAREQVLKSLLERRFNKLFEPEIVPKPIVLSGNWKKAGQLGLVECQASKGWLVMGWRRIPGTEAPPDAPALPAATPAAPAAQ